MSDKKMILELKKELYWAIRHLRININNGQQLFDALQDQGNIKVVHDNFKHNFNNDDGW